ncbi:MAG: hypothetical protein ABL921_31395 [Pirellula sp.]
MSGIIGHTMYAILGIKAAHARGLALASIAMRHWASYLAGAYIGSDIQTMPEAICVDTGQEVGYGTVPLSHSPITNGPMKPWSLKHNGNEYRPSQIHQLFYGRSHFVFGWSRAEQEHSIPWDHLPDYCSLLIDDTVQMHGPAERPLAYVLGWMAHIVGDCLIKSVQPGITLNLLDGKYTAKNRPIQDLVTYHEVGIKELGLNWPALLADLADTPVEQVQLHGMRVSKPQGQLARDFPYGWAPEKEPLLLAVLKENRRYLKRYILTVQSDLQLHKNGNTWECSEPMQQASGGLTYSEMLEIAEMARFRNALWQMGEAVADLFQAVTERSEALRTLAAETQLTWRELTKRWKANESKPF